ncbi:MAG: DUF6431 domain-containing protein [Clostridiales bacterium]|nr:DUF6431 domain-containing protein [Clostridiales bacterium]
MIRLFTALCKIYLKELSEKQRFLAAKEEFNHLDGACPKCGAKGKLSEYGDYGRGLTSYEGCQIVDSDIRASRLYCSSCESTHALLPDIVVPYSPYSLPFMLAALIAYYERAMTVEKICAHFGIAVSTIYDWKARMTFHKDLMLGLLISRKAPSLGFLRSLIRSCRLSDTLRRFYHSHSFSFMQRRSAPATRNRPP